MREGFRATEAEAVVCYDADCTYPIEDIPRLLEGLSRGEVVTAVPVLPADREARPPLVRRLLTRAVALAYRVVLGRGAGGVTVFTCAFRAYRRPAILACLPRSDGFSAAAEILSRALLQGLTVAEVPSVLGKRVHGRSKMRVVRAGLGHARVLGCGLLWRLGWPRSPRHG
jgi:hypothetical protein